MSLNFVPDVFATLKPANALAKLAFSDVYASFRDRQQNTQNDDHPAIRCMNVEFEPKYQADVHQLQREVKQKLKDGKGVDIDNSLPKLTSGTEKSVESKKLAMIWMGDYIFSFALEPLNPELGWRAGKSSLPGQRSHPADLFLCTADFAKKHDISIRSLHARFNFEIHRRSFFIARMTDSPDFALTVNGDIVDRRMFTLNQYSMNVRVDKLEYVFEYTKYSQTPLFSQDRQDYLINSMQGPVNVDFEMPTPLQETQRIIKPWTLAKELGKGTVGKVFLGSNARNDVVAVKIIKGKPKTGDWLDRELRTLAAVTAMAEMYDQNGRIVRVREMIRLPEEIAVILEPMTPQTANKLIEEGNMGGSRGMSMEVAGIFRDVLLGVQVLHNHGWLHGDLKPSNIGVMGTPLRAVILDTGSAMYLEPGSTLKPEPESGGTLDYIAPEREMDEYDHSVDIWSLGCIGYELTYGEHPWSLSVNPWRDDSNQSLGSGRDYYGLFEQKYEEAMDELSQDFSVFRSRTPQDGDFLHLGGLLQQMLRIPRDPYNHQPRIIIDEALQHDAWGPLLPDQRQVKRDRRDEPSGKK